ncbi:hypothetical protein EDC94DRAFT_699331 [Helicostylum pulchrum]|nr:hypothetical protein EDC94DRAFT_699331 [Helicostylum pulchrum]
MYATLNFNDYISSGRGPGCDPEKAAIYINISSEYDAKAMELHLRIRIPDEQKVKWRRMVKAFKEEFTRRHTTGAAAPTEEASNQTLLRQLLPVAEHERPEASRDTEPPSTRKRTVTSPPASILSTNAPSITSRRRQGASTPDMKTMLNRIVDREHVFRQGIFREVREHMESRELISDARGDALLAALNRASDIAERNGAIMREAYDLFLQQSRNQ